MHVLRSVTHGPNERERKREITRHQLLAHVKSVALQGNAIYNVEVMDANLSCVFIFLSASRVLTLVFTRYSDIFWHIHTEIKTAGEATTTILQATEKHAQCTREIKRKKNQKPKGKKNQ